MHGRFIPYYRVSTDRQGERGLGLDAQRATVKRQLDGGQWEIVAEFVEVETATKKGVRPQLQEALRQCRLTSSTLIVAKLDRMTRDASFLGPTLASEVDVLFCDLPLVKGAAGRAMLQMMAVFAELEAGLISERTKGALAQAKARGVKLGSPKGAEHLLVSGKSLEGLSKGRAAQRARMERRDAELRRVVEEIGIEGRTLDGIKTELEVRKVTTGTGRIEWTKCSVERLLWRLGVRERPPVVRRTWRKRQARQMRVIDAGKVDQEVSDDERVR